MNMLQGIGVFLMGCVAAAVVALMTNAIVNTGLWASLGIPEFNSNFCLVFPLLVIIASAYAAFRIATRRDEGSK